jgi:hypothetical protein
LKTTCIAMGNYRPTKTWHTCLHTIEFWTRENRGL